MKALWISRGTEAAGEAVVDDDVGRVAVAPRHAAEVGVAAPEATAQHAVRPSRGSCGVGHAS